MFKRIALVTVSALGFGLLSSVSPVSATSASAIAAYVGPGNQTSLTVVGGDSLTTAALVRIDMTVDSATGTSGDATGLSCNESITATVLSGPKTSSKTGSMSDTSTVAGSGSPSRSDFSIIEIAAASQGSAATVATTSGASTTDWTDWSRIETSTSGTFTNWDSSTTVGGRVLLGASQGSGANDGRRQAADGVIGCANTYRLNMDGTRQATTNPNKVSYYVSISPRLSSTVIDEGAYTFQFELTDTNGNRVGVSTVKIDFVSASTKSDATLTLGTAGTFIRSAALGTTDTDGNTYANVTLKNRDGGLVRTNLGDAPTLTTRIQQYTTSAPVYTETVTIVASDTGLADADFGVAGAGGTGTLRPQDGVYGIRTAGVTGLLPGIKTTATDSAQIYRWNILYGNATPITTALTLFEASGAGTASAYYTDVLVTAAGMSAADSLLISNDADGAKTWTLPTSTTSATVKFYIQTSSNVATAGQEMTVTPTWSGSHGSASVTPATSTTGTTYTTDADGTFSVSVTNAAPVSGASLALKVTSGAAFGAQSYTATLTWATPAAASIAVADPLSGVYVKTSSTNVTTVIVKDQFGNPVADQSVTVSLGQTSANYSATTTIAPIKTGANGTATYSLVGGATTATLDTLTFQCAPTACGTAATMTYNYVSTVPAVGSLAGYFNQEWDSTTTVAPVTGYTLWPASGDLYQTGTTTDLVLKTDLNTSKAMDSYADKNNDALVAFALYGLTSAGVAAQGAVVTLSAASGGHILDAAGLPVASRNFLIGSTGWTSKIQILATKTGSITFTATSGTVSKTFNMKVSNAATDARFISISGAASGTANGAGVPVTVSVTDRFGNPVGSVALVVRASGVGSLVGGSTSTSFNTDAEGTYTFLATSLESAGGVGTFTASSSTAADFGSLKGYVGATEIDSTVLAGNSSKALNITFAAGQNSAQVAAEAATDAALEAIDAANAATDAANLAAEAADAATVAAEEARDAADAATAAVEALASEVATLIAGLKAQITTLANTVAKIAKKVKA